MEFRLSCTNPLEWMIFKLISKLNWRHWTYKMLVRYVLSSVCLRLSQFHHLSFMHHLGLCIFSLPISLVMSVIICVFLSCYHHQIGIMNHQPLFRVRSWNNGMCYMSCHILNSLAPGSFQWNLRKIIFKLILVTDGYEISSEIALRWRSLDFSDDKSTLVQVMAWCRQATSHYLNQSWPRSLTPYGITRPQWVKDRYLEHFQWSCPQTNATRPNELHVNAGLGNGLVVSGNKPSREPMLTRFISQYGFIGTMTKDHSKWYSCSLFSCAHCQISNISHTESQNWNVFRLILQLSMPNPLKPSVKLRMKI